MDHPVTVRICCHGGVVEGSFVYFFGRNSVAALPAHFHTHNTSPTHWKLDPPSTPAPRGRLMR
jgi:probable phosphoglycerate mutase